ncbi:Osmolarity sensor protein EnvZ [Komagataeibacter saccharivorans]|uniref:histidine kinase n=1 Tax=Komagataeibacter saccharivorans TaxID=265959 RepID=A0A347WEG2_9PROT|nr:ATP-binding protein [Komagataeibacter saccharivorans]AXY23255.1 Osmolarity sensor protein EnvZ [Komagataeibacter saccharivorans]
MKTRFSLLPRTVYGQMVAIVISSMMVTIFVVAFLVFVLRPTVPPLPEGPWPNALAIETAIDALRAGPPEIRAVIARGMSTPDVSFQTTGPFPCVPIPTEHFSVLLRRILKAQMNNRNAVIKESTCAADSSGMTSTHIDMPREGIFITAHNGINHHLPQLMRATLPLIVSFLSLLVIMGTLSLWSLWRINRPLKVLANKAETFGYDITPEPLTEQGPVELRRVARAFNRMQARIAAAAEERTRMLMAIGHDLRTPLTRLSMRIEMGGADASPAALRNDLWLMNRMLNGALSFLKGQGDTEPAERVDIGALVESVCAEFEATGRNVIYQGDLGLTCLCQPVAVSRMVNNLIDNACKFGSTVQVDTRRNGNEAIIEVADDGPGIPTEMHDVVLLPFARLDPARSSDGGLGLGLSIIHDIVQRHRGSLNFQSNQPHGLRVCIALPLDPQQFTHARSRTHSVH